MKFVRSLIVPLLLAGILNAATLHLKRREVRTDARTGTIEDPGPRWTGGRSHLLLQFRHPLNEQMVQNLHQRGAYVVAALPDFGAAVSVQDGFSLQGLDIEWAGRLGLYDKISPSLEHSRGTADRWFVAEFFPDVDMQEARRLVEAAGFRVREHRDLIPNHLLFSGSSSRLSGLAQWDEVAYIFQASRALVRGEHLTACAGAVTSAGVTPMFATTGSGWSKDASGQVTLAYALGSMSPKLNSLQANEEILRALNAWTQYAPIKFVAGESASGTRTVYVRFATRDHGDGFPFDGPGGTLAHTFYPAPPNPEPIAGDMHLDADEDWHIGANTDLFTVALHEAGHALGLAHVDNPSSVMYPYYRLGSKIAADDIAGIQSLYGLPAGSSPIVPSDPSLSVAIATPAPGFNTTSSTVAMSGTTSGAGEAVQVSWQSNKGASGVATGTAKWNVAAIPLNVGSNTITVTAMDGSLSAVATVIVMRAAPPENPGPSSDHTSPSLAITTPSGTIVSTMASAIELKGTATDNVGVSKVTWQSSAGSGTATDTTTWSSGSIPLLVGNNNIIVRAYDAAGNTSWRSVLVIRN